MRVRIQLLTLERCWSISAGSSLTALLTALISLQVATTCLPAWRMVAITVLQQQWGVVGRTWLISQAADLFDTGIRKLIAHYDTCASVLALTTLRSNLSMYVLFVFSHVWVTIDGVWMLIGFIDHLHIVTTSNYNAMTNSHTLQFTTARIKSFQSAVSSPVVAW
jgi:hypothetical protein